MHACAGADCCSKWGARGWSLSLHDALKEFGIRVRLSPDQRCTKGRLELWLMLGLCPGDHDLSTCHQHAHDMGQA